MPEYNVTYESKDCTLSRKVYAESFAEVIDACRGQAVTISREGSAQELAADLENIIGKQQ